MYMLKRGTKKFVFREINFSITVYYKIFFKCNISPVITEVFQIIQNLISLNLMYFTFCSFLLNKVYFIMLFFIIFKTRFTLEVLFG